MNPLPIALLLSAGTGFMFQSCQVQKKTEPQRPNILLAISDDQSFPHTSFSGCKFINTPAFDRIAGEGIFFTNCYAGSPGSAPSRSSLVTGRYHWQNEQSGQHSSSWMKKYVPFIDLLERNGYYTGRTGKGVAPFRYAQSDNDSLWRKDDAGGVEHSRISYTEGENDERTATGISPNNYFENFRHFMENRKTGDPFFFWYGAHEPHRKYEKGSWKRMGKKLEDAEVPGFLPDNEVIRGDLLDYAVEIEWFDLHLGRMIQYLEEKGELDNTIIIVTADNGMPFPRAKANCFEYGVHVPLAIRFPGQFPGKRVVEDLISFADFAPTLLELTGTSAEGMLPMSGKSFRNILESGRSGITDAAKKYIFAGRERHSCSRWNNLGYPQRMIRDNQYMLIWNMHPNRWPAGAPRAIVNGRLMPLYGIDKDGKHQSEWAFTDVDASPSKSLLAENHKNPEIKPFFDLSFAKRPEYELYDILNDPYCLNNLSENPAYCRVEVELRSVLVKELERSEDPRLVGPDPDIFDTYIRYAPMREFPKE